MQGLRKHRRWADGDTTQGGPGGVAIMGAPEAPQPIGLELETAKSICDLYLRGGATNYVPLRQSLVLAARMRSAGLIDTRLDTRGHQTAKLEPRGLQALVEARAVTQAAQSAPSI